MARASEADGVTDRARVGQRSDGTATDRELAVVAAVVAAGSEKAAAHRLGLSHSTVKHHLASARSKVGAATTAQLVWILAPRLPGPVDRAQTDDQWVCPPPLVGAQDSWSTFICAIHASRVGTTGSTKAMTK